MATVPRNRTMRSRLGHDGETRRALEDLYHGFLSDVQHKLVQSNGCIEAVHNVMDDLFLALREHRLTSTGAEWSKFVQRCRVHPLCTLLHEDPFTHRAFTKPRGYAGDAELMDFIYGHEEHWPPPPASRLGASIFDYTTRAPAAEGVRARRGFIADLIDNVAATRRGARVLSIAAGHLREAAISSAVRRRRLERFVALDSDEKSLLEIRRNYGIHGVETVPARVTRLLGQRLDLGQFDLIYSLGLFDYLAQPLGQRIVARLFEMLRSNGRLLVANFLPGIRDIGYMEAFMDWQLVYRTRHEMIDLTSEISQSDIREIQLFAEENQNIIFVMIVKG